LIEKGYTETCPIGSWYDTAGGFPLHVFIFPSSSMLLDKAVNRMAENRREI
jgi:hypothetical protein